MKMKVFVTLIVILTMFRISQGIFVVKNETKIQEKIRINRNSGSVANKSSTEWTDPYDDDYDSLKIWGKLLEDYTLGQIPKSSRQGRVIQQQGPHRYIPASSNLYITKRIGEAMELEPHMRPPGKVISSTSPSNIGGMPPSYSPTRQQNFQPSHHLREVSETDLYLLGAMEKLVYRVDYLENRLRRTEQIVYYLMAGNNQKEEVKLCAKNFTRIGDGCYHIAGAGKSSPAVNWKTANNICKSISSHLAEFERPAENEELIAFILNHPEYRGKDFWLGGLNPGLLWIWSNSAKPVNPNTNLTTILNSVPKNETQDQQKAQDNLKENNTDKILNNSSEIKGNGRCLRLSYNPSKHAYIYYGQECTSRHHYVCEYHDKSLDNQIKKIARDLKFE